MNSNVSALIVGEHGIILSCQNLIGIPLFQVMLARLNLSDKLILLDSF